MQEGLSECPFCLRLVAYQTLQTQNPNFTEFLNNILSIKSKLAPSQRTTICVNLFFKFTTLPDSQQGGSMSILDFGIDQCCLLAVRDTNDICLEIQNARRQVLDGVKRDKSLQCQSGLVICFYFIL